jgi:hypothetical protein
MPDTVQHAQARHVRRCAVTAGGNLKALIIAALNAQAYGRGDAIAPWVMGVRIISASASFTVANPDGTAALTIPTSAVPYDIPATQGAADTEVGGGATLGVEVYYTGNPTVP